MTAQLIFSTPFASLKSYCCTVTPIMARHQSSDNTLRVPKSHLYSSMIHPNSTSSLDSPSLYPLLHSESPARPYTSSAQHHAIAGRLRRKNIREMIGTTTEDEFDALPLAVRRKVRAFLASSRLDDGMLLCNAIHMGDGKFGIPAPSAHFLHKMKKIAAKKGPLFPAID
jgi:hypothetical protein